MIRPSSDIKQARDNLLDLARWLEEDGLDFEAGVIHKTLPLMWRGFSGRHTPVKRGSLTPYLAADIRLTAKAHPTWSQDEIGRYHNVAGGRVSEALAGHDWSPGKPRRR